MKKIKPIHKLNGGTGAILCNECSVIINTGMTEELFCEQHKNKYDANNVKLKEIPKVKYTLKRLDDGLTKTGYRILYIEYDGEDNKSHDNIKIGYSLMLDPRMQFTWLTTAIVEIVKQEDKYIKFQTKNSTYELIQHF